MSWIERLKRLAERPAGRLSAIGGALLGDVRGNPGPVDLGGERSVVLALDAGLPELAGAGELLVVASAPPAAGSLPPHTFVALDDPGLARALAQHAATRVVLVSLASARLAPLRLALRAGARQVDLVYGPGLTVRASPSGALGLVAWRRSESAAAALPGVRRLCARLGWRLAWTTPTRASSRRAAAAIVDRLGPPAELPDGPLRILHHTSGLGPGGAERQLSYLVRAQAVAGHAVSVLTRLPLEGDDAHYAPELRRAGVRLETLRELPVWRELPEACASLAPAVREALDEHAARAQLAPLVACFVRERPHVVHTWQDEPNLAGALAALAAGVPRVVIGARSVNPTHYPQRYQPWFREAYRALARCDRVAFTANSRAAADDYADWMGVDRGRFQVAPNGLPLDAWTPLSAEARRAGRAALGIDPEAFLVAGVFRLSAEKRPADFVEAIARAHAQVPALRAIHVGDGALWPETLRLAQARGLDGVLQFLGRRERPDELLGLADASLLASQVEGSPNVSLESQALEVPVILTRVFGSPETVREGETGYVVEVGDVAGMAERLVHLAEDPARARALGRAGRAFMRERFTLEAALERALRLYRTGSVEASA